jgi:hypothetical protein
MQACGLRGRLHSNPRRQKRMNSTVTIGIDVPNLEQGVLFYTRAFGFTKKAASIPGLAVLHGLNVELCLLEKAPGSRPSISTSDFRRYERH